MRLGWFGSFGVHVLIVAATLIAWPRGEKELPPASGIVPVDIIDTISEITNVSAIAPAPSEELPDDEIAPEGAAQSVAPPTPPDVEAVNDPRQKQKLKQKDRQPVSNLNDFAALIDRSKTKDGRPVESNANAERGERPRRAIGAGSDLTMSEPDAIASAIDRKWMNFSDFPSPERYWVSIRIQLNADGTLARPPQVTATSLPMSDPYMRVAVERSMRAVQAAEPLPVDPNRTTRATFTMHFFLRS